MARATVFISSSGAVSPCATNWVISMVAMIEKIVTMRSSVAVLRAITTSSVVIVTELMTSAPSAAFTERYGSSGRRLSQKRAHRPGFAARTGG